MKEIDRPARNDKIRRLRERIRAPIKHLRYVGRLHPGRFLRILLPIATKMGLFSGVVLNWAVSQDRSTAYLTIQRPSLRHSAKRRHSESILRGRKFTSQLAQDLAVNSDRLQEGSSNLIQRQEPAFSQMRQAAKRARVATQTEDATDRCINGHEHAWAYDGQTLTNTRWTCDVCGKSKLD